MPSIGLRQRAKHRSRLALRGRPSAAAASALIKAFHARMRTERRRPVARLVVLEPDLDVFAQCVAVNSLATHLAFPRQPERAEAGALVMRGAQEQRSSPVTVSGMCSRATSRRRPSIQFSRPVGQPAVVPDSRLRRRNGAPGNQTCSITCPAARPSASTSSQRTGRKRLAVLVDGQRMQADRHAHGKLGIVELVLPRIGGVHDARQAEGACTVSKTPTTSGTVGAAAYLPAKVRAGPASFRPRS